MAQLHFTFTNRVAAIGFRRGWKHNGYTLAQLPYRAAFGVWGSWFGVVINILALIANFYIALFPIEAKPSAEAFFKGYLAALVLLVFYTGWKLKTKNWRLFVRTEDIDVLTGLSL